MLRAKRTLGILGGLGPMSSVYFYELLTEHTDATRDQEHIDIIISSRATTPDRTAYITGASRENPLPVMLDEAERLERAGADLIAVPCNTAHYFYEALREHSRVPVLNIIELTVAYAEHVGSRCVGLMATEGTVLGGAYGAACSHHSIECLTPDAEHQSLLNSIIYGAVKRGEKPADGALGAVSEHLFERGAESVILGCTELSLARRGCARDDRYIDSLEVLAACTICVCGKDLRGIHHTLAEFARSTTMTETRVIV